MELVVEARLENGARNPYIGTLYAGFATTRYTVCAPFDLPMIVGFLDGQESLKVETFGLNADTRWLALSWRCYHDFGCARCDYEVMGV